MPEPLSLSSPLLSGYGIPAMFSLRRGGVSPAPFDSLNLGHHVGDSESCVAENMQRLCRDAGLPEPHRTAQVHGCDILECAGPGRLHQTPADILVSATPGTAVAVRTADCLPLLLASPAAGLVAAVHAGWRGTAAQAARIATEALIGRGAAVENIYASIGPCIGPCCFEVGPEVAAALTRNRPGLAIREEKTTGRFYPDLAAINRQQLLESGVQPAQIETIATCTACHSTRFFSHRRDHGRTGRHLAVVALPSAT